MAGKCTALAIFCDDIRSEIGNKISMIGVYGADIQFNAKPPIMYPKLGIVVWVWGERADLPDRMTVKVLVQPSKAEIFSVELEKPEAQAIGNGKLARVQVAVGISPIAVEKPGHLEVEVHTGTETLSAGRLELKFNPPAPAPVISASA